MKRRTMRSRIRNSIRRKRRRTKRLDVGEEEKEK